MVIAPRRPGIGLSYRRQFDAEPLHYTGAIDLIELIADNVPTAVIEEPLAAILAQFPIVCHSLGLSIGTDEPVDQAYLDMVARTVERVGGCWLSDHFAMTRVSGMELVI